MSLLNVGSGAVATTTAGPWASMIYAASTDSGLVVIDLGWFGGARGLRRMTKTLGTTPDGLRWVFLTHAHRDHIGAWRSVRRARFALGNAEVPYFAGAARYAGFIPRVGDRLISYARPSVGELQLVPIVSDTSFVLGRDTLRAFPLAGHTAGSVAYLFRGILFVGDAGNWRLLSGFRGARAEFSDDVGQSRRSMASLWKRIDAAGLQVSAVCTAHAKCAPADSALRARLLR